MPSGVVRGSRELPGISSTGFLGDGDSTEPVVPEDPFHRALGQPGAERAGLDHVVDVALDTGDRDQSDDLTGVAASVTPERAALPDTGRLDAWSMVMPRLLYHHHRVPTFALTRWADSASSGAASRR